MPPSSHSLPILLLFLATATFCGVLDALNDRPIIGIVTEPTDGSLARHGSEYFAASYVKWIESAGGRVVPLRYTADQDTLATLFKQVNGVLFTGGGVSLNHSAYEKAGSFLYGLALEANKAGDYFPIWGTCLGFEELVIIAAGNNASVLGSGFDSENISMPLEFAPAASTSRMFASASADLLDIFKTKAVTMNNHGSGVTPDTFAQNPLLQAYSVLSTNKDRNQKPFVSTIEAKNYPFYGSQWHPEKPLFEWRADEAIPHDMNAILANQYVARFFVQECRQSSHVFSDPVAEKNALIYNYSPLYTEDISPSFEQCYLFG